MMIIANAEFKGKELIVGWDQKLAAFVLVKRERKNIKSILERHGMSMDDLKCSVCGKDLSDLKHLGMIFPYHSALICCDNIDCLLKCRDKLIKD